MCLPQPWTDTCPCLIALHHHRHVGRSFLWPGSPEAALSYHQTGGASGQTGGGKEDSGLPYISLDQAPKCITLPTFYFFRKYVPRLYLNYYSLERKNMHKT